jgi:hypothetical protein
MKTFQPSLQFSIANDDRETTRLIRDYAEQYLENDDGRRKDQLALDAGASIKGGSYTKEKFRIIFEWKLSSFLKRNFPYLKTADAIDEAEIEDALRIAVTARTDRAVIAVLMGLPGVKLRVASAIAAMIWPQRFTILDVRALAGLGVANTADNGSIDFYLEYVAACQRLAEHYGVDLRTLDRALFRWSEIQPKPSKAKRKI